MEGAAFGRNSLCNAYGVSILASILQPLLRYPKSVKGRFAMNFIIWIVVGGIIGWIASKIMKVATLSSKRSEG